MLRAMLIRTKTGDYQLGGEELIEQWQNDEQTMIWVDLSDLEPSQERTLLEKTFWIHPLAVQDAMLKRHPPKIERFDDHLFVLLRGLDAETEDIDFGVIQIAMFLGKRYFVTRHSSVSPSTDWLWKRAQKDPALRTQGAELLAVRLIGRVVRRYVPILLALEPRLEAIEAEIFERPRDELLEEVTNYKSHLKHLRRIFTYHEQVVGALKSAPEPFISARLHHELVDVYDQIERSFSLATLYYDLSTDLVEAYLALSAHRLNQVMKVLTIITVIFVPLSFLAGIYGMNFENMPELRQPRAYFILLGVMATVVTAQLVLFRRKGWL